MNTVNISGGTRSATGSSVRMALATRFGTWLAQGCDPLEACLQTLCAPSP